MPLRALTVSTLKSSNYFTRQILCLTSAQSYQPQNNVS